ncbi:MAG TPA: hypothetical protein DCR42_03420 [Flavobacteriaceae bacterium]|jgi:hypothetical protein|nr:hypothetical protein [Flavobacteriaceae bacterium]
MIRIYFIGLFILITAILANFLSAKLHLKSWYDLFEGLAGTPNYRDLLTLKDELWLFFIYPSLLGVGSTFANLLYLKLFST